MDYCHRIQFHLNCFQKYIPVLPCMTPKYMYYWIDMSMISLCTFHSDNDRQLYKNLNPRISYRLLEVWHCICGEKITKGIVALISAAVDVSGTTIPFLYTYSVDKSQWSTDCLSDNHYVEHMVERIRTVLASIYL